MIKFVNETNMVNFNFLQNLWSFLYFTPLDPFPPQKAIVLVTIQGSSNRNVILFPTTITGATKEMVLGRVVSCPALSMWNRKRENTKETRDGLKLLDARARELFTRVTRVYVEGGEYKTWWLSVSCNWRRVTSFHEAIRFLLNYSNFEPVNRNGRALTSIINIGFSFWNVLSLPLVSKVLANYTYLHVSLSSHLILSYLILFYLILSWLLCL